MYINRNSQNVDAAWEFVKFITAPEQQRFRAVEGSFLPTLNELYNDQEIQEQVPAIELGGDIVENNTRSRPVTPFYSDISARLASGFNANLRGEMSPEETVQKLQTELQNIIEQNT
jgi:multiple sugar transport system substrate-binding protein